MAQGKLRSASILATLRTLYPAFPAIGGVAHTHSEYATSWAQTRRPIPCFRTTHADYFHGCVPVTPAMSDDEIREEYEKNTGNVIVRALNKLDTSATPGILVANHGPFTWGPDPRTAAHNAVILESLARMAYFTVTLNSAAQPIGRTLHDKHYLSNHGQNADYGQTRKGN